MNSVRPFLLILFTVFSFSSLSAQQLIDHDRKLLRALEGRTLKDTSQRQQVVKELREVQQSQRDQARQVARTQGKQLRRVLPNGRVLEVAKVDASGRLIYRSTKNLNAVVSIGANNLPPIGGTIINGNTVTLGVWDAGAVRTNHIEFQTNRVTLGNVSPLDSHATHVAGTIAARGANASAVGVAPSSKISSYDWDEDVSEVASVAATLPRESGKLPVSNHSYGYVRGWDWDGSRYVWEGSSTIEDAEFGLYNSEAALVDGISYDAPYYLMFWAAGNDRSDNPSTGSTVVINGNSVTYDPTIHPKGDGQFRGGYENIADNAVCKNVVSVGSVGDAVLNGVRTLSRATNTTYSCWGPTDDGRIKPDLVANGHTVFSATSTGATNYSTLSGTSMASPAAAGAASLIIDNFNNNFWNTTHKFSSTLGLKGATVKALLIHTADDLGPVGPDYQTGWGLINTAAAIAHLNAHKQDSPQMDSRIGNFQEDGYGTARKLIREDVLGSTTPVKTFNFTSDGVTPVKVTLCWMDPKATNNTSANSRTPRLVHDLDLTLTSPTGTVYRPYVMPFVGTWTQESLSLSATSGDNNTDNVEQIRLNAPEKGVYTVTVRLANSLTTPSQAYSLLVSGGVLGGPPVLGGLPEQKVTLEEAKGRRSITQRVFLSDDYTLPEQLYLTVTSNNLSIVPTHSISVGPLSYANREAYRDVTFDIPANSSGDFRLEYKVYDGQRLTNWFVNYEVTPFDDPPVISQIPNQSLLVGQNVVLGPFLINLSDMDDDISIYSVNAYSSNPDFLPAENIVVLGSGSTREVYVFLRDNWFGLTTVTLAAEMPPPLPNPEDQELWNRKRGTMSFEVNVNKNPNDHTFESWSALKIPSDGKLGRTEDHDGDGVNNLMEFFLGLDPSLKNPSPEFLVQYLGNQVSVTYRKSTTARNIHGVIEWASFLGDGNFWTTQTVSDVLVETQGEIEIRRATVSLDETDKSVYFRLNVIH
jgi:subtilisin family serine protease